MTIDSRWLTLSLLCGSLSVPVCAQESENNAKLPVRHDACASGKVLSVERHGDRFAVVVSVGTEDGVRVGLQDSVFIGPYLNLQPNAAFPKDYTATGKVVEVGNDRATCNIGPSRYSKRHGTPEVGDLVAVRRWHRPATFVVARNVVIHDGKIYDWNSIPDRLAALNEAGLIAPGIRFTWSLFGESEERQEVFGDWCREATGRRSYSTGFVGGNVANDYDALELDGPPLRDRSAHKVGTVEFNGKRVANAEIIVCTLGESWTKEVYLEHGRLRDPADEPTRTLSELNGKFDCFPESEAFQLVSRTGIRRCKQRTVAPEPRH